MGSEASETAWWPSLCDTSPTSVTKRGGAAPPSNLTTPPTSRGASSSLDQIRWIPHCLPMHAIGSIASPDLTSCECSPTQAAGSGISRSHYGCSSLHPLVSKPAFHLHAGMPVESKPLPPPTADASYLARSTL